MAHSSRSLYARPSRRRRPPARATRLLAGLMPLTLCLALAVGLGLAGLAPGLPGYSGAGVVAVGPYGGPSDATPPGDTTPPGGAVTSGDTASPGGHPDFAEPLPFSLQARAIILIDAGSGQVLTEHDADQPLPLASVTKLMTLRLVLEALRAGTISLDQVVTASAAVQRELPPYSSRMFLAAGDEVTVEQLLYGLTVASGNDACIALAELLAGTQSELVKAMNRRAGELGLGTTHFADSHGYSPDNRMSAGELAAFARDLVNEFPEALAYVSAESFTYSGITQFNNNHLLWTYDGCDGLKTGYTRAAGYNLVATADRGGHRLIAVMLGVPRTVEGRWGWSYRDQAVAGILDWGFTNFEQVRPLSDWTTALPVFKGDHDQVVAVPAEDVAFSVPTELADSVELMPELAGPYAVAPVADGQPLGTIVISVAGHELDRVTLVADAAVPRGGLFTVVWDTVRLAFIPGD